MIANSHRFRSGDADAIASVDTPPIEEVRRRTHLLLATVAHELRNPLQSLVSAVELLSLPSNEDVTAQATCTARRQLQQMGQLIEQLLDAGCIDSGQIVMHMARVRLQDVLAGAVETTAPAFARRRHTLKLELPDEPIWIHADPVRCAQVFGNLLMNAAKYTPPHGLVTLTAREGAGFARVCVIDNGVGIAPEVLDGVFNMFSQEERSGDLCEGGLGIGLAVVSQLVQLHGGAVHAESAGVHEGATFTVWLPLSIHGSDIACPLGH